MRSPYLTGGLLFTALAIGSTSQAEPGPAGPQLDFGPPAALQSVYGSTRNPAGPASDGRHRFRTGLVGFGAGYEIGPVDNFFDDMDQILDDMEDLEARYDTLDNQNDAMQLANDLHDLETSANQTLNKFARDGYAKVGIAGNFPLTPLIVAHDRIGGALTLDAQAGLLGRAGVLHRKNALALLPGEGSFDENAVEYDDSTGEFRYQNEEVVQPAFPEDTALDVRGGRIDTLAIGYGRPVAELGGGQLSAGVKASYYRVELARIAVSFEEVDDDELEDIAEDRFDENQRRESSLGVDLGLVWATDRFRIGGTLSNLNEPTFRFPCEGASCDILEAHDAADARFTMKRQLTLEGAYQPGGLNWVLGGSIEARAVPDIGGDEYQWASVHGGYMTDSWWIPGFRLGYRTSITGTDISYVSSGLTLFRIVQLDVAAATDRIEIDGDSMPRAVQASLGVELSF